MRTILAQFSAILSIVMAATPFQIEKMAKAGRQVIYTPDEVVFKEAGSQLFTAEGQMIQEW